MRIPKLRSGSFFPEDVVERYQRVDRAVVSAVAEMHATGTSMRKVQRIAEKLGISRLPQDLNAPPPQLTQTTSTLSKSTVLPLPNIIYHARIL